MKEPMIKWLKEHLPTKLPGVTVNDNFGPPVYQDGQQKFVVQGRKGKPDVIEAVLEGMIAYQRAGLLAPIDDLFEKWADKDQFIPSTIKALTLNGKLYGVPYNTNVRVLLIAKISSKNMVFLCQKPGMKCCRRRQQFRPSNQEWPASG